ncbi:hypothetical protein OQA88_3902 [Cercophora sp. LCS_1]
MDRPRDASLLGGSVPHSATPPLALSDLLAQRPFPPYTPAYERPSTSPEATYENADEPIAQVVVSANDTPTSPEQPERLPSPFKTDQLQTVPPVPSQIPSTADWQAKRNQLRPSRNQGSKGDWIRGWSEGVGAHGLETYCACSESSLVGEQTWTARGGELKSGVRALWRGKRSISIAQSSTVTTTTTISEPDVCRNCSRMPSPPASAAGSVKDDSEGLSQRSSFARKINDMIQRAKRKGKGQVEGSGVPQLTRSAISETVNTPRGFRDSISNPGKHRIGPNGHRLGTGHDPNLPNGRGSGPKSGQASPERTSAPDQRRNISSDTQRAPQTPEAGGFSPSPAASLSNSDNPRGDHGISASMSRLERAAALLNRQSTIDQPQRND